MSKEPYRRTYGVIFRRHSYGPSIWGSRDRRDWVIDGGRDAPLTSRGRVAFRAVFVAVLVLGFAALVLLELD